MMQPLDHFHRNISAPDGHQYYCKDCHRRRKQQYRKHPPGPIIMHLEGKIYGRWFVASLSSIINQRSMWNCVCECGTRRVVVGTSLRFGSSRSCGCLSREITSNRCRLSIDEAVMSIQNAIIQGYKKRALSAGRPFTLTHQQILSIFSEDCFYCGAPPSNQRLKWRDKGFAYNGLDRFDNTGGYTLGNVVPCCRICNTAKMDMTPQFFLNWVRQVASRTASIVIDEESDVA